MKTTITNIFRAAAITAFAAMILVSCEKENTLPSTGNITFNPHTLTIEPGADSEFQAVCYTAGVINENVPFTLRSDSEFLTVDETVVYKGLNNLRVKSSYQGEDRIKASINAYALDGTLIGTLQVTLNPVIRYKYVDLDVQGVYILEQRGSSVDAQSGKAVDVKVRVVQNDGDYIDIVPGCGVPVQIHISPEGAIKKTAGKDGFSYRFVAGGNTGERGMAMVSFSYGGVTSEQVLHINYKN